MVLENATWPTVFAPVALVYAMVCVLPSALPMQRPWARRLVLAAVAAAMLRYLYWRVSETLITEGAVASVWSSCCIGSTEGSCRHGVSAVSKAAHDSGCR